MDSGVEYEYAPCLKKNACNFYFLNNSRNRWPILIIFGKQHHEET